MALSLIDYGAGTVDLTITPAGGGTAISVKCQLSSIAFEFTRDVRNMPTLCSGNWSQNFNGVKSARFVATGYPAKGTNALKPGTYFLADSYPLIVFTADTGCTIGMTSTITRETVGLVALANGTYTLEGMNYGSDIAVAWVTS